MVWVPQERKRTLTWIMQMWMIDAWFSFLRLISIYSQLALFWSSVLADPTVTSIERTMTAPWPRMPCAAYGVMIKTFSALAGQPSSDSKLGLRICTSFAFISHLRF